MGLCSANYKVCRYGHIAPLLFAAGVSGRKAWPSLGLNRPGACDRGGELHLQNSILQQKKLLLLRYCVDFMAFVMLGYMGFQGRPVATE